MKYIVLGILLIINLYAKDDIKNSFNNNKNSIINIIYGIDKDITRDIVNEISTMIFQHLQQKIIDFKGVTENHTRYIKDILKIVNRGKPIDTALKQKDEQITKLKKEIEKFKKDSDEIFDNILNRAEQALKKYELDKYHTILQEYENNETTKKTLKNLAKIYYLRAKQYQDSGYYKKAEKFIEKAVANDEENFEYLYLYSIVLYSNANYDKSIECSENLIKNINKSFDIKLPDIIKGYSIKIESPRIAKIYNTLGLVWNAKGNFDKAIEYFQKELNINKKFLKTYHLNNAIVYHNIGNAWKNKGYYDKALMYFKKSLNINLKVSEPNNINIASNYNSLGIIWRYKKNYNKSIKYFKKALKIRLRKLRKDHPSIASTYISLGITIKEKRNYDKALEYYQKALNIYLKSYKVNHPNIALLYRHIGIIWSEKGKYIKAIKYFKKALEIRLKSLSTSRSYYLMTLYSDLGLAWDNEGDYDKAVEYYKKSLAISLKSDDSNILALTYYNYGIALAHKGNYNKAVEFTKKGLIAFKNDLGTSHPYTKTAKKLLNQLKDIKNNYSKK